MSKIITCSLIVIFFIVGSSDYLFADSETEKISDRTIREFVDDIYCLPDLQKKIMTQGHDIADKGCDKLLERKEIESGSERKKCGQNALEAIIWLYQSREITKNLIHKTLPICFEQGVGEKYPINPVTKRLIELNSSILSKEHNRNKKFFISAYADGEKVNAGQQLTKEEEERIVAKIVAERKNVVKMDITNIINWEERPYKKEPQKVFIRKEE